AIPHRQPVPSPLLLPLKPQPAQHRQHRGQQVPPHRFRGLAAQGKLLPPEPAHAPQEEGQPQAQGLPAAHRPVAHNGIPVPVGGASAPPPQDLLLPVRKLQSHRWEHIPSGAAGRSMASRKAPKPSSSAFCCSRSFSSTATRSVSLTSTAPLLLRLNSVRHRRSSPSIW